MASEAGRSRLIAPFTLSAILHAAIAMLLFNTLKERKPVALPPLDTPPRDSKPVALPPMYRVNIVAAPPGERAIGEVKSGQAKATTSVTQSSAAQSSPKEAPLPKAKPAQKTPARATPSVAKAAKAGAPDGNGGPEP